jgi:hypothetical protein
VGKGLGMEIHLTPAEQQTITAHSSYVRALVSLAMGIGTSLHAQPYPMPDDVANPYRATADLMLEATLAWAGPSHAFL